MTQTTWSDAAPGYGHQAECRAARPRRWGLTAVVALGVSGAALIGAGAFSSWNATTSVSSGSLSTGSVAVSLLDANGGAFSSGVSDLLPGDFFYRYVDVRNTGTTGSTFTGTVNATGDLSGQMAVEAASCTLPWTTVGGLSVCAGTTTPIGSGTPGGSPVTVSHGAISPGALAAQHVRYKFTLPSGAPDSLQGKTGTVSIGVSNTVVGGNDRTNG